MTPFVLQKIPEFMIGIRQNADNAHKELSANIRGFFVEMPLDWGANQGKAPRTPFNQNKIIAERVLEKDQQKDFSV